MGRINGLLLIIGLSLAAACSRAPSAEVSERLPVKEQASASVVPVSDINLASIGSIAPKGRVQDPDYNDLAVVNSLIQQGREAIPYLISKLDDETKIEGHVMDYWSDVRVADVAFITLTDFFTDSSWQHTTLPGVGWDEFLERGGNRDLTAEQVLRNYISKHGRKTIKDRWQALWREYGDRVFWDNKERCFRVTPTVGKIVFSGASVLGQETIAPQFALKDLNGRMVQLRAYRGKVVLINFWATWCPPCRAEMPDLVRLQRQYAKQGLQIIGITYPPETKTRVRRFARSLKVNYPIILGTRQIKARFSSEETLPLTVVIDRDGKVTDVISGILLRQEFDQKIKPLLTRNTEGEMRNAKSDH